MKDYQNFSKIKNTARNLLLKERFRRRLNHHHKSFELKPGVVPDRVNFLDDERLIERLKNFYSRSIANFENNTDSVWSAIFMKLHGDIHTAFVTADNAKIVDIIRNPGGYNFFYGFENLCKDLVTAKRLEDILEPELVMDGLISLCEAVGVLNLANPESLKIKKSLTAEAAIELLENKFGFEINFPNPFKGEYGLSIRGEVASYRAVQAIYQAWRIFDTVKHIPNPKVIEIGGGLGRTAYYCRKFGVKNYSIVDIPISSLAQANFIARTLSEDDLLLKGEDGMEIREKINLIDTKSFFDSETIFDLVVNVDSLTELDITVAKEYFNKISDTAKFFLSINHENNLFSINSLWSEKPVMNKLYRNLCWVRRGYVEELFENNIAN